LQSDTAARLRSAGLAALVPGVAAATFAASATGSTPARADTAPVATNTQPAPQPLRATFKKHNVLAGKSVPVTGTLLTHERGRKVLLQVNAGHGWHTVDRTKTDQFGRFRARFRPHGLGGYRMRVRLVGPTVAPASLGPQPAPTRTHGKVLVYRKTFASWYGPGFIGGRTACGGTLGAGTMGVANKTLPCGTRVTLRYHGRVARARVVDRGPYVSGREWDLTPAVKAKLGFPSTGVVWSTR
jgi:rare lipoprotein A